MKSKLIVGAAAAALACGLAASAGAAKNSDKAEPPAQNIERDERARTKARYRDWLGFGRRLFVRGKEVRSFDGSGNNQDDPLAGAAFRPFQRITYADYSDGVSVMAGPLRASAREISNAVAAQDDRDFPNGYGASDYLWQWGQFIDHDITLGDAIHSDDRSFDIKVPAWDPWFDPAGAGDKTMRFDRAIFDETSGTGPDNPRAPINELSSWIDGSMVYGSSEDRARALRTLDGTGRLKTSRGDLLPFNKDGLPNANGPARDPSALFLAGDVRANEQVGLAVMHTLFVREHNRWARFIRRTKPFYSGDDIYHAARRMVIAEIQIVTYNEFLPALIGEEALDDYEGYTPGDGTMFAEFSGAAFRLGHTLINPQLMRVNRRGKEIRDGHLPLHNAFFNAPEILKKRRDVDPFLRGLAAQKHQAMDCFMVDDLRNFLFGPPGAGGFDLASLNIQRGRDLGLPSYNDTRAALGLGRADGFEDISSDPNVQAALFKAYGSIDNVDLWMGGVCEETQSDSQLGPLFTKIVAEQFRALRDHDRFWWERDLTRTEQRLVRHIRLADIIIANSGVGYGEISRNVFYARGVEKPKYPWTLRP